MSVDNEEKPEAEKETPGPGPKTPTEAKDAGAGSEPRDSDRPLKGKPRKITLDGARRLTCRRCGHFLMEVKSKDFEAVTVCHRCKTENFFAFTELK